MKSFTLAGLVLCMVGSCSCVDPKTLNDKIKKIKSFPYETYSPPKLDARDLQMMDEEAIACGSGRPHVLTNMTGRFTSPLHPSTYPDNSHCEWSILYEQYAANVTDGRVMIDFSYFNTEYCCDGVYITDGSTDTGIILAVYRGAYPADALPATVITSIYNPGMFVKFTSDATFGAVGFTALYTSDSACIGSQTTFLSGDGQFTSPYYPYTYIHEKECRWNVSNQQGEIRFDTFKIGTGTTGNCLNAYLFYHTDVDGDHYLCGSSIPPTIYVSGGVVSFRFYSPSTYYAVDGEGFSASYSTYAVTTTIPTTPPPTGSTSAPANIEPMPYLVLPLNGTMTTSPYTISPDCNNKYTTAFRNSFETVITQTNGKISRHELCGYTNGTQLVSGAVSLITQSPTITVKFETLVRSTDGQVIGDVESCSMDVAPVISNTSYWPNPIIAPISGCPAPIMSPNWFDYVTPKWNAYN